MPKKNNQWENPNYKYEVIEKKDDSNESVLLKSGITSKFSLNDVVKDLEYFKGRKREFEAKINVEEAIMKNVLRGYPEIEKVEEKTRMAYLLYQRSYEVVKQVKEALEVVNKQIDEEAVQIDEIEKQTGIKLVKPEETK